MILYTCKELENLKSQTTQLHSYLLKRVRMDLLSDGGWALTVGGGWYGPPGAVPVLGECDRRTNRTHHNARLSLQVKALAVPARNKNLYLWLGANMLFDWKLDAFQ